MHTKIGGLRYDCHVALRIAFTLQDAVLVDLSRCSSDSYDSIEIARRCTSTEIYSPGQKDKYKTVLRLKYARTLFCLRILHICDAKIVEMIFFLKK